MRQIRPGRDTAAVLALACLAFAVVPAGAVDYGPYHDFAEVEAQLQAWAAEHPELVRLETFGESAGGRPLYAVEVAADGPVEPSARPAVFVGANIAGFHNAGTEAALDLVETLLAGAGGETAELLASRTFYVAPVLNPDAHDALFAAVRQRRAGNASRLDRDRDGFLAEDGFDDLDGDGRITGLRIPDPAGGWLPHPDEPRLLVKADPVKGWAGTHRKAGEGRDDDGDGELNEDPAEGVAPDRNFGHGFPYPDPGAGPWPGFAPETKAVMDYLLARRNVAAAVVYGPANNFLAAPQSFGGGSGDLGTQTFKLPAQAAEFLGFDPEEEYTIDQVWEVAKDLPFVRQNNITKDQLAQFLGAGPATELEDEDLALIARLGKDYEKRLEEAGLDTGRPAEQYSRGGITPWLYYQYGALAVELDVWGIPKAAAEEGEGEGEDGEALTLDRLAEMSPEEFVALGEEKVAAFLEEVGAPPQFTAAMVIQRVESGQITPQQMAKMAEQMGGGGGGGAGAAPGEDDAGTKRRREVLAWVDANAPEAFAPWTEVTLADGTRAEAGGLDPFIEVAPPAEALAPALAVHTATVLDLAKRLARVEVLSLEVQDLGGGVHRVRAVAGNRGELPTHTQLGERGRFHLPVRLEILPGRGAELVTGHAAVTAERLAGSSGTLEGTWLVRASPGTEIAVEVVTDTAGSDRKTHTISRGGSR